jgi:microcystin-dependent protein
MSDPFVGEVRPWALNFAPSGWAFCQGQLLSISQNASLFALIGTYYGGNGTSNFALPDLRSRIPISYGTDIGGNYYVIGEQGGVEQVQLLTAQMPVHTHVVGGSSAAGGSKSPLSGCIMASAKQGASFYAPGNTPGLISINPGTVSVYAGGNQPHSNIQPYQAINWCIALRGIFPARN